MQQSEPATFVDVLRMRAAADGDRSAFTMLADGEQESGHITYAGLEFRARQIAARLQSMCGPGDRVLLVCSPGLDYIAGFFGCLMGGMVAVPAYPPDPTAPRQLARIPAILENAGAVVALSSSDVADGVAELFAQHPSVGELTWISIDEFDGAGWAERWSEPDIHAASPAFFQYTSGSTSRPKAVVVTHGNLIDNCAAIFEGFCMDERDRLVCWLPLFHDMGLIGNILMPLRYALPAVLMTPQAFIQRPMRWLEAIARYGGTVTMAPNFAFDLCIAKSTPESRAELDLSSWRVSVNGAEPVSAATLERFSDKFTSSGWQHQNFVPAYGLAEATLYVSGDCSTEPPAVVNADARALLKHRVIRAVGDDPVRRLVSSGRPSPHHDIRIVDPDTLAELPEDRVGEIWLAGPSVAAGYWQNPEATEEVFGARLASGAGPFVRTGDLGFRSDGELFITGRIKDVIIVRGGNHYPQDVELAAESAHPALRPHCSAAFTVDGNDDSLVVVAEVRRDLDPEDLRGAANAVRAAVQEATELHADTVVLIRAGTLPKTTSGKIQRRPTKAAFLAGALKIEYTDGRPPQPGPAVAQPFGPMTMGALLTGRLDDPGTTDEVARHLAAHGLHQVWLPGHAEMPDLVPPGSEQAPIARALTGLGVSVVAGASTDTDTEDRVELVTAGPAGAGWMACSTAAEVASTARAGMDVLLLPSPEADTGVDDVRSLIAGFLRLRPTGGRVAVACSPGAGGSDPPMTPWLAVADPAAAVPAAIDLRNAGVEHLVYIVDLGRDLDSVLDAVGSLSGLHRRLARAGAVRPPGPGPTAGSIAAPERPNPPQSSSPSVLDRCERESDSTRRVAIIEEHLRVLIAEAVQRPGTGLADVATLRATGLDSLMVVNVVNALQESLRLDIDPGEFYQHDTSTEFATELERRLSGTRASVTIAVPPEPTGDGRATADRTTTTDPTPTGSGGLRRRRRQQRFPLSLPQQQLWFLEQLAPGTAAYHEPITLRLHGPLNVDALDRSLAAVVAGHEALRTTFGTDAGAPIQIVSDLGNVERLAVVDLRGASEGDAELATQIAEHVRRPFDLASGPLLRCAVYRLADEHHVLSLVGHHLAVDGTTLQILYRELGAAYTAFCAGRDHVPEPADLDYPDFALWQRETIAEPAMEQHRTYWRSQLAGVPELLQLPTDRPRPAVQRYAGTTRTYLFPSELIDRLRRTGRDHDATLFMTLFAAYAWLIARQSGQDDFVIGTPTAGRNRPELQNLVGMFVNLLPLRADTSGDPTAGELLERVRHTCVSAYAHQDCPFEFVIDDQNPVRDLSYHPLLQSVFALQNAAPEDLVLRGLGVSRMLIDSNSSRFDLSFSLFAGSDGLRCLVEYNTDLFAPPTIDRLAGQYERILDRFAQDPDERLRSLTLDDERERAAVARRNDTAAPVPSSPFHEQVFAQARRTPDRVAVTAGDAHMTYRALCHRASRLAAALRMRGVAPEVGVGVLLERGVDSIVALLAVLAAGGVYIPLDPGHPADRRREIIADSGCALVLTRSGNTDKLSVPTLLIDAVQDPPSGRPQAAPDTSVLSSQLAYVIHTSGSTGRPKGVMITHRSLANMTPVLAGGIGPGDAESREGGSAVHRVLALAAFTFDASLWDIVMALAFGGTLCIARDDERLPGPVLTRLLARQGVTHATLAPTALAALAEDPGSALRVVVSTTEAITESVVRRWADRHRLIDGYGPTESTIGAMLAEVESGRSRATLGRPFANTQIHVLDSDLQPMPVGAIGEIFIGGVGVARGYLGRPALTAERFVPDALAVEPGARLYRTGDLARRITGGELAFVGRADDQVKVRGFRIEPGEIEAVLRRHSSVAGAAVVAWPMASGAVQLVAYLVAPAGTDLDDVRELAAQALPDYMLPSAFVLLDKLPTTSTGKTDRGALPAPLSGLQVDPSEEPRGETEILIARIWAELLGSDQVGRQTDFFSAGGDSILSIQLCARAAEGGLDMTPASVFRHRTVAELARMITAQGPGRTSDVTLVEPTGPMPAAPIQQWFLDQKLPAPEHFTQSIVLRINEVLDEAALQSALDEVVAHHAALRISCGLDGVLQVRPIGQVPAPYLEVVDLVDCDPADQSVRFADRAAALQAGHDLGCGCLLRVLYAPFGPAGGRLVLSAHHLAVDGVSWRILIDDLTTAYGQASLGLEIKLPQTTAPFREWALDRATRPADDEIAHWSRLLRWAASAPPVSPGRVGDADDVTVTLDPTVTRSLLRNSSPGHLRDVLLASVADAVCGWTGESQVLVDVEGHGRTAEDGPDVSRTVGWFTSLFPVLLDGSAVLLDGNAVPREHLAQVRSAVEMTPDAGRGYSALRAAGTLPFSPAIVCVNYLGQLDLSFGDGARWQWADESPGPTQHADQVRPYLLDVVAYVLGDRLHIRWGYPARDLQRGAVVQLAERAAEAARRFAEISTSGDEAEDSYPLSATQEGMLYQAARDPRSGVYVVQLSFSLDANADLDAWRAAWEHVFARHTALRTSFHRGPDGRAEQRVARTVELPWAVLDHRSKDTADSGTQAVLEDVYARDRAWGFDLERAPLARMTLVHLSTGVRFVWTHHHLLLDGWSLPLVLGEVLDAYRALVSGEQPDLSAGLPFRSFVDWLDDHRSEREQSAARWTDALRGITAPTPLPVDDSETTDPGTGEQRFTLPPDVSDALAGFTRQHGITAGTVVQAVWAIVLARHARVSDVVFFTTVSGRPPQLQGADGAVGLFIRTLPVRARLDAAAPVCDWLRHWQTELAELRADDAVGLVDIQGWSDCPRGTSLSESLVVVENYPLSEEAARERAGIRLRDIRVHEQTEAALTLVAMPGTTVRLRLLYDTSRHSAAGCARLLDQVAEVLGQLVTAPVGATLGDLVLPVGTEDAPGLPQRPAPAHPQPLIVRLQRQVRERPDAVALCTGARQLTYRRLARRVAGLASQLDHVGVRPESKVGLLLDRGAEQVIALLAIHAAGGAYVPIDPNYPTARIRHLIEDSGLAAIVTSTDLADQIPPEHRDRVPLVVPDSWDAHPDRMLEASADPDRMLEASPAGEHLAYIMYTSGSTGVPKGVMIEHRQLARLFDAAQAHVDVTSDDVWTMFHSVAFDFSVWEMWGALSAGGRLILVDDQVRRAPERFAALIDEQAVTVLSQTPSAFAALDRAVRSGAYPLPDLRFVVFGGEALVPERTALFAEHVGTGARMINMYGITETTVHVTAGEVTEQSSSRLGSPIGRPLLDLSVAVLDGAMRALPVGAIGELHVGGDGVARGYLNQPGLTADRFRPDPSGYRAGARVYRTGDLARRGSDGTLHYLGRCDDQVKIRGHRIELGEVESVLRSVRGVADAAVARREDVPGREQLVAYVVPAGGGAAGAGMVAIVRDEARRLLPAHEVPGAYVVLERLPTTTHGKLDRVALPAPAGDRTGVASRYAPPRTRTERTLAEAWQNLLGVESVGRNDNFFDLGGHSLLAAQLQARLRSLNNVELPLSVLFESTDLGELAARLESSSVGTAGPGEVPATNRGAESTHPLSFAQQRMAFLERWTPGTGIYHIAGGLRLEGPLDRPALAAALNDIAARHEILRTVLVEHDGDIAQVIEPEARVDLPVIDASGADRSGRPALIDSELRRIADKPFDLFDAPAWRVALIEVDDDVAVLALCLHHIVADGRSLEILIGDLAAGYAARKSASADNRPGLAMQYADYARWQRNYVAGSAKPQLEYWAATLRGLPATTLVTDRPRPDFQTHESALRRVTLSLSATASIPRLAASTHTTPFMVLLAVTAIALAQVQDRSEVVAGTPVANRNRTELAGLIGYLANTIVLRLETTGSTTFDDLLGHVRTVCSNAYDHAELPFELVVRELAPERSAGHLPLFQWWFVVQDEPDPRRLFAGLDATPVNTPSGLARYDLRLEFRRHHDELEFVCQYKTGLFESTTIDRLTAHVLRVLDMVQAEPAISLATLRTALDSADAAVRSRALVALGDFSSSALRRRPRSSDRTLVTRRSDPPVEN